MLSTAASSVDLTPILTAVISIVATALGIFGSWALAALARRLGVQLSQQQQDMFDSALHKLITLGATKSMGLIEARGWDHPEVKDAIVAAAMQVAVQKFPDALKAVGIVPDSPEFKVKIRDALERAYPLSMTSIVASPVTPDAAPGAQQVQAIDVSTHEVKT